MNKNLFIVTAVVSVFFLFVTSCNNNSDDPDPSYTLTQTDLNKSTSAVDLDVTGREYGDGVSIPHNGQPVPPENTYRDIYKKNSKKSTDAFGLGTVYTKRTYLKNEDGSKGDLLVTFAMVKRESGYFSDGGDWEYIMMPNDGSNDYGTNPNGTLPPTSATDMRGQLANCASCHAQAGNDFLFAESEIPAFKATQADLNASTNIEDFNVTGTKYGEDVSIPHNGMPISVDSTYRDIYSNIGEKENVRVGAVFTKSTYMKHADGSKGALQVTFAMIKREDGYYPLGGDFEYVMMPNDGSNDYDVNPNGMLPDEGSEMRGQLANCASCHAKTSEYLFVRGE